MDPVQIGALAHEIGTEVSHGAFGYRASQGGIKTLRTSGIYTGDIEADCSDLQKAAKATSFLLGVFGVNPDIPDLPVPISAPVLQFFSLPKNWSIRPVQSAELFKGFSKALELFLGIRFALTSRFPTNTGIRPMISFTVHTRYDDGRVHYSPCYYISNRSVFGAPTTPVRGQIDPGRYVFAVEYPGGPMQPDNGVYDVPKDQTAHLNV